MKKTRYTEEQIAFALKQAETGTRVGEVCRKMSISEATFYIFDQCILNKLAYQPGLAHKAENIFSQIDTQIDEIHGDSPAEHISYS